jgi:putative transposase
MPDFRRAFRPGGTFFFTLVTERRAPLLCQPLARRLLAGAIRDCRLSRPFDAQAMVLLPDHLHAIWTLPPGDGEFSVRWASIKATFTRGWLGANGGEQGRTGSRICGRRRGVWQRRFWEHLIEDADDFARHLDYVHYNPVKHRLAACPHAWPFSTFGKWVRRGVYEPDWQCVCAGRSVVPPAMRAMDSTARE